MRRDIIKMEYKYIKDIDINQLVELFSSVGWESAKYPNKLYNAIKNSDYVISVWNQEELVGLIAAISDGYVNAFITYLLVKPEYQGQKIGSNLMEKVCDHYKGFRRKILSTELDKQKYYEKFGFAIDGIVMFNNNWIKDEVGTNEAQKKQ